MLDFNATFVAVILNFIILMWVLTYFLYNPVMKVLEERKTHVDETLAQADAKMAAARAFFEEGRSSIDKANHTAKELIEQSRVAAETMQKEQSSRTLSEISEMKERAKDEIKLYKAEAQKTLVNEAARLSVIMAEKLIRTKITPGAEKELVDEFINEVRN
jgi:F-type H+-transporting ATPase subunit b